MDHARRVGHIGRHRRVTAQLIGIALVVPTIGTMALSLALFTDQESVDATFGTGTVQLDDAKVDSLALGTSAMMPGDALTDDVVIENDGTAELRYSMTSSSTDADGAGLRDALLLTVKTEDVTTPGTPCDDFDGLTTLFTGALGAADAAFGDPAAGADAGDRVLAAAASETLCFRVSLPADTGDSAQGASTTTTFTFDAEQTANNP